MYPRRIAAALSILVPLSLAALAPRALAGDPAPGDKTQREIRRVERSLDEMLIESPNFLVPGYDNARGLYVPGTGAIFTFEASLVAANGQRFKISAHGHNTWFSWMGDDEEDDDKADSGSRRGTHARRLAREEKQYNRGTDELMDLLLDEADTLTSLKPGEWVQLIAYFDNIDYLWDKDITHLSIKVKVDDLRAYGDKKLSEEQVKARIVKEEY